MTFLSKFIGSAALVAASFATAQETPETIDWNIYGGFESSSYNTHMPVLGGRIEHKDFIYDLHLGGFHNKIFNTSISTAKAEIGVYHNLYKTEKTSSYLGLAVGGYMVNVKSDFLSMHSGEIVKYKETKYALLPAVVLGQSVKTSDRQKVFMEISYSPYNVEKDYNKFTHRLAFRIGYGF